MILTLYRDNGGLESTIGRLFIGEGVTEYHFCFTCEDQSQVKKVKGETRIPAGTYEIKLRRGSPMGKKYDERYSDIGHDGMIHLQNVPNFKYIYVHTGNTHEHSEGCILVGFDCYTDDSLGGGRIGRSVAAYKALYPKIYSALEKGEQVFITIKDEGVK